VSERSGAHPPTHPPTSKPPTNYSAQFVMRPRFISLGAAVGFLSSKIQLRKQFCQDFKVDLDRRTEIMQQHKASIELNEEESADVQRGNILLKTFRNSESNKKIQIRSQNDGIISTSAVQFEGRAWCYSAVTVRCEVSERSERALRKTRILATTKPTNIILNSIRTFFARRRRRRR